MGRTQLIAALVLIVAAAGLIAGRVALNDDDAATEAALAGGAETPGAEADAEAEETTTTTTEPIPEPERLGPAEEFAGLDGWLQTDADSLADFDGQVRIVQFWTFACHNCTATIPHLQGIYERHQADGLEIIGVHTPEFDFERDPDAVAAAAVDLGVTWPIALDPNKVSFRQWQPGRRFWPRTFVVDQEGEVRYNHIGEGRYDELEETVAYLIENGPGSTGA
ncbi:MAG: redoxin domain-containing protein [Actinomycetota bacterium]